VDESETSARIRSRRLSGKMSELRNENASEDEGDGKTSGKGTGKSRRELPAGAVATLKAWLLSPEHFTHPYPTPQDQVMLMQKTGIDKKQLKNWFTNARRRIWKPMLKKQLEQGKLAATGAGGGGVAVPGVVPGLMVPPMPGTSAAPLPGTEVTPENPHSVQAIHAHYQHAIHQHGQQAPQQQGQPQQYDQYGNQIYVHQLQVPPAAAPTTSAQSQSNYTTQYYTSQQQFGQQSNINHRVGEIAPSSSIGSLAPMATTSGNIAPSPAMNKTDSHAVLMELFARDQDLVRQATESAKIKVTTKVVGLADDPNHPQLGIQGVSQHPMKMGSQAKLMNVPTLNSWPHFSSISSLNNLGTMTGVKSITSMSGVDLANQGNMNKMGNLAQVKSMESMGKNDSYAFLEVFFGDRNINSINMSGKDQERGLKREREEDNDVGLSLDADESPSTSAGKASMEIMPTRHPGAPVPAPLPTKGNESFSDTDTLKRAYDDALAARGLMSVSRSSEKLTELALPAKMRKTLSQEYLRKHQAQAQIVQKQKQSSTQKYNQYTFASTDIASSALSSQKTQIAAPSSTSQQYPGQHPQQQQLTHPVGSNQLIQQDRAPLSSTNTSGEVRVPLASTCAKCHQPGVDTQLRPCGHMFHERCLKPSLQVSVGKPKCPIDNIPIQSALLAVPDEQKSKQLAVPQQPIQQAQETWHANPKSFQSTVPSESTSKA